MYAIIVTGGKQYKVEEGASIYVEKLDAKEGDKVTFDQVIFVGGDDTKIGTPVVDGASVEGTVDKQGKEKKGLKIVGLKLVHPSKELASAHYAEHESKPFFGELVDYLSSGPVVAMVLQADDCVLLTRKLVGKTKPSEAEPGTIRGDYCTHTNRNIIHASDSDESAEREIKLWFKDDEIFDWQDCEAGCY